MHKIIALAAAALLFAAVAVGAAEPTTLPVTSASATRGTLDGRGDSDLYSLQLAARQIVAIGAFSGLATVGAIRAELLDPGGQVLHAIRLSSETAQVIEYRASSTATYHVRVVGDPSRWPPAEAEGGYSLWARPDCAGSLRTECRWNTDGWAARTWAGPSDRDCLFADLRRGRRYLFKAESEGGNPGMTLYGPGGAKIKTETTYGTTGSQIAYRAARTARHVVCLLSPDDDLPGDYRTLLTVP